MNKHLKHQYCQPNCPAYTPVSKDISSEIEDRILELFTIIDNYGTNVEARQYTRQLLQDAKIDELKAVYKEIVKNNVAGNVKWYVDDRLAELKGDINEQLDNAYDEVGDRE